MAAWVERKIAWLVAAIVLIALGVVAWAVLIAWQSTTKIHIGDAVVSATVADDQKERTKGLSGVRELGRGDGMLFVFDKSDYWGIWMKDMHIDLDIVWLNSGKKVVHIVKHVAPDTYPRVFKPEKPARYVLELPAGTVEDRRISIDDEAHFELPPR